jgi:intracellular sulfur oxidation DsrE/DsrF family protein
VKTLNIVSTGYRATLEEQDDTVLWLLQALKGAGADVDVVLRNSAVNYAVAGQNAAGLAFGERRQSQPPRIGDDLARIIAKGMRVYVVEDDLAERGIAAEDMLPGMQVMRADQLPRLIADYDNVWNW